MAAVGSLPKAVIRVPPPADEIAIDENEPPDGSVLPRQTFPAALPNGKRPYHCPVLLRRGDPIDAASQPTFSPPAHLPVLTRCGDRPAGIIDLAGRTGSFPPMHWVRAGR